MQESNFPNFTAAVDSVRLRLQCVRNKTLYIHTHACIQHAATKKKNVHATQFVCLGCVYVCADVSRGPVAPGEIYEVLRMVASSPLMGD